VRAEGEIIRLTGSLKAQYANWREILRRIFVTETGGPLEHLDLSVASGAIVSRRMASKLTQGPPKN
jgi:hypothetical protein